MFNGVVDRLLSDSIEMRGGGHIAMEPSRVSFTGATNLVSLRHRMRQFLKRGNQPFGFEPDRVQAAAHISRFGNRLVQQARNSLRGGNFRTRLFLQGAGETIGGEGQSDQLLTKPVMDV